MCSASTASRGNRCRPRTMVIKDTRCAAKARHSVFPTFALDAEKSVHLATHQRQHGKVSSNASQRALGPSRSTDETGNSVQHAVHVQRIRCACDYYPVCVLHRCRSLHIEKGWLMIFSFGAKFESFSSSYTTSSLPTHALPKYLMSALFFLMFRGLVIKYSLRPQLSKAKTLYVMRAQSSGQKHAVV